MTSECEREDDEYEYVPEADDYEYELDDDRSHEKDDTPSTSRYDSFPEIVPTREELHQLARYHLTTLYVIDVFWGLYGVASGSDNRDYLYAEERVTMIEDAIGPEELKEINQKISDEYRRKVGERNWRILTTGSKEEREQLRMERHRRANRRHDKRVGAPPG